MLPMSWNNRTTNNLGTRNQKPGTNYPPAFSRLGRDSAGKQSTFLFTPQNIIDKVIGEIAIVVELFRKRKILGFLMGKPFSKDA